jgi:hypothetical protein
MEFVGVGKIRQAQSPAVSRLSATLGTLRGGRETNVESFALRLKPVRQRIVELPVAAVRGSLRSLRRLNRAARSPHWRGHSQGKPSLLESALGGCQ